jgi:hypothetical protein
VEGVQRVVATDEKENFMGDSKDKKYPISLFLMGVVMNLLKNFILLLLALVFLVIGIGVQWCLELGLGLLALNVVIAFVQQLQIRNTTLSSDNLDFQQWQEAMLSPEWMKNIKEMTEHKILENGDEPAEEEE